MQYLYCFLIVGLLATLPVFSLAEDPQNTETSSVEEKSVPPAESLGTPVEVGGDDNPVLRDSPSGNPLKPRNKKKINLEERERLNNEYTLKKLESAPYSPVSEEALQRVAKDNTCDIRSKIHSLGIGLSTSAVDFNGKQEGICPDGRSGHQISVSPSHVQDDKTTTPSPGPLLTVQELKGKQVLSLGEGTSGVAPYLVSKGVDVVGLDLDYRTSAPTAADQILQRVPWVSPRPFLSSGLKSKNGLVQKPILLRGDATDFSGKELGRTGRTFQQNGFDHIISNFLYCEMSFDDVERSLMEGLRVLKTGGTFRNVFEKHGQMNNSEDPAIYKKLLDEVRAKARSEGYDVQFFTYDLKDTARSDHGALKKVDYDLLIIKKVPLTSAANDRGPTSSKKRE